MLEQYDSTPENVTLSNGMRAVKPSVITTPRNRALSQYVVPVSRRLCVRMPRIYNRHVLEEPVRDLPGDIWAALVDPEARLAPVKNGRIINAALMRHLFDNPEFQALRNALAYRTYTAAQAAADIATSILNSDLGARMLSAGQDQEQDEGEDGDGEGQQGQRQGQQGQQGGQQDCNKQSNIGGGGNKTGRSNEAAVQQLLNRIQNSPIASGMISSIVSGTRDGVQKRDEMLSAFGFGRGIDSQTNMAEIYKFVDGYKNAIEQMAEMIGRLVGIGRDTAERTIAAEFGVVAEIATTHDLTKILPTQMAYMSRMAPPILRGMTTAAWASHGLPGWQKKASASKKGSFVILVDGSGSMQGNKALLAKAFAIGIAKTITGEDFGKGVAHGKTELRYSMGEFADEPQIRWCRDTATSEEHMKWAMTIDGGGTDFNYALSGMANEIENLAKQGAVGVDGVIVTDGYGFLDKETVKRVKNIMEQYSARLHYIQIDGVPNALISSISSRVVATTSGALSKAVDEATIEIVKDIISGRERQQ